jgi:hypothetical protein
MNAGLPFCELACWYPVKPQSPSDAPRSGAGLDRMPQPAILDCKPAIRLKINSLYRCLCNQVVVITAHIMQGVRIDS